MFKRLVGGPIEALIARVTHQEGNIATAQGRIAALAKELSEIDEDSREIADQMTAAMGSGDDPSSLLAGLEARCSKLEARKAQCLRMKTAAEKSIVFAKLHIAQLETGIDEQQAKYWAQNKEKAFERVWLALEEPLRAAVIYAGAAEYHEQLHRGENVAAAAWARVTADSLLEYELCEYLCARIRAARAKIHDGISIDAPPRGLPRIRALRSQALNRDERQVMDQLAKRGQAPSADDLQSGLLDLAKSRIESSPSQEHFDLPTALRNWRSEVTRLELSIEEERTRVYPSLVDGRPVDGERCRKERMASLNARLGKAQTTLKDLESRTVSAA
jgi:hypothetical protein